MILEKQTEALVQQEGVTEDSIGMSLDLDSAQILMQMLSKNLYSDSIGSTIRECASNALDSHRRAGVDMPIIVSFKTNNEGNYEFSVEDFGIGLDADDVKNIISKYGKSTKRNSNTELGMMGLGFKAPLAYSSSFYFVCRKNGMERKYMMYEGEEVNTIDLLYETATDEDNGVKVIVPVNYYDRHSFRKKIKEQLAYFESVYFDCEGYVPNDFHIYREEHYQSSDISEDSSLHICLDNVYYPIDFKKLGIDEIEIPLGLRFSLTDGIFPTPNRESIRYTAESKQKILDKIGVVATDIVTRFNKTMGEVNDFKLVVEYYKYDDRSFNLFEATKINIKGISKFSKVLVQGPKMNGIQHLNFASIMDNKYYFLCEYSERYTLSNNTMSQINYNTTVDVVDVKEDNYYIFSDKISQRKKEYLKSILPRGKKHCFVKKDGSLSLSKPLSSKNNMNYVKLLRLNSYPKSQWRTIIQEFQLCIKTITDKFINLDELVIPDTFETAQQKKAKMLKLAKAGTNSVAKRQPKLQGEVIGKLATCLERWVDGKHCKWVSDRFDIKKCSKDGVFYIYGSDKHVLKMDKYFEYLNKTNKLNKVKLIQFSQREFEVVEDFKMHNWINFDKFMEGKTMVFKRTVTAELIYKLKCDFENTFKKSSVLGYVSKDIAGKIESLSNYMKKHHSHINDSLMKDMLEIADNTKLYDFSAYWTYLEVKKFLTENSFVETVLKPISVYTSSNDKYISVIADLFKYHKLTPDKQHFITTNKNQQANEEMTEQN